MEGEESGSTLAFDAVLNGGGETDLALAPPVTRGTSIRVVVGGGGIPAAVRRALEERIADLIQAELDRRQTPPPEPQTMVAISLQGLGPDGHSASGLVEAVRPRIEQLVAEQLSSEQVEEVAEGAAVQTTLQPLAAPLAAVCVCAGYSPPASEYSVANPRAVAGPLPHVYAYYFFEDTVRVRVEDDPSLSGCQMLVGLASQVSWAKEIAAWHLCNGQVSSVSTSGSNVGPNLMLVQKAECQSGSHTLLFKKAKTFGVMTGMYCFDIDTFWPFWGGKKLTFAWLSDTFGSGKWGHQGTFSSVRPDGTLLKDDDRPEVYVVFGGARFWIPSPAEFAAHGFDWNNVAVVPAGTAVAIATSPRDGTLLKKRSKPEVYVVYGGAKFWIPSPAAFDALGFDWSLVRTIPDGSAASIPNVPRDSTILKEASTDPVYLMSGGKKFHVSSPMRFDELCLHWDNLRTVPDGALGALPLGGVL